MKYGGIIGLCGLAAFVLGGCSSDGGLFLFGATHNEGPVDYRVVPIEVKRLTDTSGYDEPSGLIGLGDKSLKPYSSDSKSPPLKTIPNPTAEDPNGKKITVRLRLKQAFLKNFNETSRVGEVAVVLNVKESNEGWANSDIKDGRIVYYSEGVRKNAFINFRDQPVFGPIEYKGGDLQIRASILELDEKDNEQSSAMLKSLASIGATAYPPSSPVLGVLEKVGGALLKLNGDDIEWDYAMSLSRRYPSRSKGVLDSWLQDGYFVMVRSDPSKPRITDEEWGALKFDTLSATLKTSTGSEYLERSYLVFSVQTGFDSTELDVKENAATLSQLLDTQKPGSDVIDGAVKDIIKSLEKSLDRGKASRAKSMRGMMESSEEKPADTSRDPE